MLRSVTSISLGLTTFAKERQKNVYKKQKIEKKRGVSKTEKGEKRCIKNIKERK